MVFRLLSTDSGEEEVVEFSHSNAERKVYKYILIDKFNLAIVIFWYFLFFENSKSCSLTFANTNDESFHVKISGEGKKTPSV